MGWFPSKLTMIFARFIFQQHQKRSKSMAIAKRSKFLGVANNQISIEWLTIFKINEESAVYSSVWLRYLPRPRSNLCIVDVVEIEIQPVAWTIFLKSGIPYQLQQPPCQARTRVLVSSLERGKLGEGYALCEIERPNGRGDCYTKRLKY